jgi:uncharacterized protein (TIGR02453 family)
MIHQATLDFFNDLKVNNNKEWFDQNRNRYEAARSNILAVTQALINELAPLDPTIASANLEPSKCLTRINRDIRFSQDKSPYKPMMVIMLGAKKEHLASSCYCLFVEPGNIFVGGGAHHPETSHLKKIRQEIYYNFDHWKSIVEAPSFKNVFPNGLRKDDTLSRVPNDFDKNHPSAEYLKLKGFIATTNITDEAITRADIKDKIVASFKAVQPLVHFINQAIATD